MRVNEIPVYCIFKEVSVKKFLNFLVENFSLFGVHEYINNARKSLDPTLLQ